LPYDVAVDARGDVYVTDSDNHRMQKFGPDGELVVAWGGPGPGPGQFRQPLGVALDGTLDVFVADSGHDRVQKFAQPAPPHPAPVPSAAVASPVTAVVRFTG
jgi:DNA-binding beta-propeller fold protein YncE